MIWSESENLKWKTALPGPGSSSPIVVGERVFVTCYSGYGLDKDNPGDPATLKRHLVCIDAGDGRILWDKSVAGVLPETAYKGQIQQHGYASSTPASDGQRVYTFFGKSGVFAFDLEGTQVWHRDVGRDTDKMKWGSAASVTLYNDLVIIDAWDESKTLYALNKKDGEVVWKKDLAETGLTFTTAVLADLGGGRVELVVALPRQVWGLNPDTGETLWFVRTTMEDNVIGTPVIVDKIAYIHGGGVKSLSSMAVRLGGSGDVTESHVIWSGKEAVSVPSPAYSDGLLHWVNSSGKACCQSLFDGKTLAGWTVLKCEAAVDNGEILIKEGNVGELAEARSTGLMKAGQWNKFKLTVQGTRASLEMNGKNAWEADGPGDPKEGFFALQAEVPGGGRHRFRNICVPELD